MNSDKAIVYHRFRLLPNQLTSLFKKASTLHKYAGADKGSHECPGGECAMLCSGWLCDACILVSNGFTNVFVVD